MRSRITSKEIEMKFAGRICAEYFDFARNLPVENKKSDLTIELSMSYLAFRVPRTEPLILHSITFKYFGIYLIVRYLRIWSIC